MKLNESNLWVLHPLETVRISGVLTEKSKLSVNEKKLKFTVSGKLLALTKYHCFYPILRIFFCCHFLMS